MAHLSGLFFFPYARPAPLHFSRFSSQPRGPVAKSRPSEPPMTSAVFFRSQEQSNMKTHFPNQNLRKIRSKWNSCSNPACTQNRGQRRHVISTKTPIKWSPRAQILKKNLTETLAPQMVTTASIHFRSCQTNCP
jgi:hypothetical protein